MADGANIEEIDFWEKSLALKSWDTLENIRLEFTSILLQLNFDPSLLDKAIISAYHFIEYMDFCFKTTFNASFKNDPRIIYLMGDIEAKYKKMHDPAIFEEEKKQLFKEIKMSLDAINDYSKEYYLKYGVHLPYSIREKWEYRVVDYLKMPTKPEVINKIESKKKG